MKKINLKKTLLAVTLAASMAVPTASFAGAAMTVNAASNVPFCADTDGNGAYNICESQIYVSRSWYDTSVHTFPVTTDNVSDENQIQMDTKYIISNGEITDLQFLANYVVNLDVCGDDLVKSDLDGLTFDVDCLRDGEESIKKCKASVTPDATDAHIFHVSFEFVADSDICSFRSSPISKTNISANLTGTIQATQDMEDFYKIEAIPADGEKLFIKIKNDPSISWGKMEKWARRLCVYANSLSKTTGVNLDTLYMEFDLDKNAENGIPPQGFSSNWTMRCGEGKYGYVGFYDSASYNEREQIATGKNVITDTVLHEMSHSYAYYVKSEFEKNYIFNQPKEGDKPWFSFDEYLTDARGLTAIQNCDNLRDTEIESRNIYGKYDEIMHILDEKYHANNHNYLPNDIKFASKLTYLDWNILEAYFAAESDNDTNLAISKVAARNLNKYMGIPVPLTENYLKFANTFRKLTILKKGAYSLTKFNSFMEEADFTVDFMRTLVTELRFYEAN